MANIPQNVLESMARICVNEKPFMDWLEADVKAESLKCILNANDQVRVLQGRAQKSLEFQKLLKESPETCRKA